MPPASGRGVNAAALPAPNTPVIPTGRPPGNCWALAPSMAAAAKHTASAAPAIPRATATGRILLHREVTLLCVDMFRVQVLLFQISRLIVRIRPLQHQPKSIVA